MLILKRLFFKNFGSYGNEGVEFDLNNAKINLIYGENGTGKSTIFDALFYVLFGKPVREKVKKEELLNRTNSKRLFVELDLEKDGIPFTIKRGMKPDIFEIWENGELKNQDGKSVDYQENITKIVGVNEKTFKQLVMIIVNQYVPYMMMDKDSKRKYIEDLIDLTVYAEIFKKAKENYNYYVKEKEKSDISVTSAKETVEMRKKILIEEREKMNTLKSSYLAEIERLTGSNALLQTRIDKAKVYLDGLKKDLECADKEIRAREILKDISDKEREIEESVKKINVLNESVVSVVESGKVAREKVDKLTETIKCLENSYNESTISINTTISLINSELSRIKKDRDFFTTNTVCPVCNSELTTRYDKIKHCNNEIEDLMARLSSLETEKNLNESKRVKISDLKVEQSKLQSELNSYTVEYQKITNAVESEKAENIKRTSAISSLNSSYATYKQDRDFGDISQFKKDTTTTLELYNGEYLKILGEFGTNNGLLTEKKRVVDSFTEEALNGYAREVVIAEDTSKLIAEKNIELTKKLRVYEAIKRIFDDNGIKLQIIKHYIPFFNKYFSEYGELMGLPFKVKITDEFDIELSDFRKREINYFTMSNGEKQRLDMMLIFVFLEIIKIKSNKNYNLALFDEILDRSLDLNGLNSLYYIFNQFVKKGATIFLISHREENKSRADVQYVVERRNFSTITTV